MLLEQLHLVWARGDGEMRSFARGQAPQDEDYAGLAAAAFECCARLLAMRRTAALVACLAAGLRAGQRFAEAYAEAKRAAGVVDFDDLIRWTENLLSQPGMGEWVRYKLDQATDHILVDEAQDTNTAQWSIVSALSEEFFAGAGAVRRHRTLFTVGDFKQAIFGFQGTDPRPSKPRGNISRRRRVPRARRRSSSTSPSASFRPNSSICRWTEASAPRRRCFELSTL